MSDRTTRLSVNIDHVATLRQARGVPYPEPLEAARIALSAGADGITIHLREDRRHIQDADVTTLCSELDARINMEMAATEFMVRVAEAALPAQVTIVPERPDEITTEGGLDLQTHVSRIQRVSTTLSESGIDISLFLDPDEQQLTALEAMDNVTGIEINTDRFSKMFLAGDEVATRAELNDIASMARAIRQRGLKVYAGHGLTVANVSGIAALPEIEELNIGHALISRAVLIGLDAAVREMLAAMES